MLPVPRIGMLVHGVCSFQSILLCRLKCRSCESKLYLNGYYISILCAASIFGRISPGLIAGKVGRYVVIVFLIRRLILFALPRFNILYISTLISSILILALWYTSFAQENLIAFAALYGMFSGPFFSVTPVILLCPDYTFIVDFLMYLPFSLVLPKYHLSSVSEQELEEHMLLWPQPRLLGRQYRACSSKSRRGITLTS